MPLANGKNVWCLCSAHNLPHMYVWISDQYFFQIDRKQMIGNCYQQIFLYVHLLLNKHLLLAFYFKVCDSALIHVSVFPFYFCSILSGIVSFFSLFFFIFTVISSPVPFCFFNSEYGFITLYVFFAFFYASFPVDYSFSCNTLLSLSDGNGNRTHNQLIRKQTLNHLAKLAK